MLTSPTLKHRAVHFCTELENSSESISHRTHYDDMPWGEGLEQRERVGNIKRWCLPTALPPRITALELQGPNCRARITTGASKHWWRRAAGVRIQPSPHHAWPKAKEMLRSVHEAKCMALSHQNNPGICDMSSPYFQHHFNTCGLVFLQRASLLPETATLMGMASGRVSIQQTGRAEAALRSHSHSSAV